MNIGADYKGDGRCSFRVWSPFAKDMKLKIVDPEKRILQMNMDDDGYWSVDADNIYPGTDYFYRMDNNIDLTDPASNYQPNDVHNASRVVDHSAFKWTDDNWSPHPLSDYIIYELHIGTFTQQGTFEAVIEKINYLKELGITVVEIMPVSQFPGERNWGYDGVYPFGVQSSYGGPYGLKKLINALHENGISVLLDVVYNHLGPEGNYLNHYAPYFTSRYQTPWGSSINFDDEYSDQVRNYFIQNALYWFESYHFDGLRLDAIDKIYDHSAHHFLAELSEEVKKLSERTGKKRTLIAESDLNDEKIIRPLNQHGIGMDAQWSDDFHHALHKLVTGESDGYYIDYNDHRDLAASLSQGFIFNGKYSKYRKRKHGNDASERDVQQFVVNIQNHDQVGNRAFGDRLSKLVSFEGYKLASAAVMLSPYTPLIFMGQEFYNEEPFIYYISHSNPELIRAVQKGRREEFSQFNWSGDIPDPYAEETFMNSRLPWDKINSDKNKVILDLYKFLIKYRKNNELFSDPSRKDIKVSYDEECKVVMLYRGSGYSKIYYLMNFEPEAVTIMADIPEGNWKKVLDTSSEEWLGPGPSAAGQLKGSRQNITLKKESFVLYESE